MSTPIPSQPGPYSCTIQVWETEMSKDQKEGGVGHVSLELTEKKREEETITQRVSLRPRYSFLVNPLLFFLPTPGVNVSSVEEDNAIEGGKPDRVIRLPLSQQEYKAMSAKAEELQTRIERTEILYHLFPGLSILHLGRSDYVTEEFSRCPFSGKALGPLHDTESGQRVQESHCALSVAEVLDPVVPIRQTRTPWYLTPTDLGNQLSNRVQDS